MTIDNKITVGDRVYVGGLIGKEFADINNKIGTIQKIIISSTMNQVVYLADVSIDNHLLPINFHYLFKITNDNIIIENKIYCSEIEHYFISHNVGEYKLGIVETGESQAICLTKEDSVVSLILTTLN